MTAAGQYSGRGGLVRTGFGGLPVCGHSLAAGTRIHLVGPLVHAVDSILAHTTSDPALCHRPTADGQSRETGYVARSLPS